MKISPFIPEQFVASKFSSQIDKARFANHLVRFVEQGCKRTMFPNWFYTRLSCCFGHIAHYNKDGFYETWFSDADSRVRFIRNIQTWGCYGDPSWTYSDVEKALRGYYATR